MKSSILVRNAGLLSMVGATMWFVSNVLEEIFHLYPPFQDHSLFVPNQILAISAVFIVAVGYLGIVWQGGVTSRFGKTSVWFYTIGYLMIVVASIAVLFTHQDETPFFLLFPIGGTLMDLGALLTGIVVARTAAWQGWTRYMPLIYAAYLWLAIEIPFYLGAYPETGPGPVPMELIQNVGMFLVGLAIYKNTVKATS
ncbi:MAG: hypothetical protein DWQ07_17080 [Chloroflexi bacterium]|nr:MAG: hypothetical protein DWQ07_17080 [Chloroflexota bacterium]MBL1195119.1 hypothetical protein [Chloroflexota bacterium]NOH12404.1 hypothetical protein [Chloroflexota bacterium]